MLLIAIFKWVSPPPGDLLGYIPVAELCESLLRRSDLSDSFIGSSLFSLGSEGSELSSCAAELKSAWLRLEEGPIIEAWLTPPGSIDTLRPVPVSVTINECSSPFMYLLPSGVLSLLGFSSFELGP